MPTSPARCAVVLAAGVLLLSSACVGANDTRQPEPVGGGKETTAGCAASSLHSGGSPNWARTAQVPTGTPYALGVGDPVAAIFFAYPLRAGHPTRPSNKVLWVVGRPRAGHPLLIAASPGDGTGNVVHFRFPANSGPGEIYPSIIDLPTPGCWHLRVEWGAHRAAIDVEVHPHSVP